MQTESNEKQTAEAAFTVTVQPVNLLHLRQILRVPDEVALQKCRENYEKFPKSVHAYRQIERRGTPNRFYIAAIAAALGQDQELIEHLLTPASAWISSQNLQEKEDS